MTGNDSVIDHCRRSAPATSWRRATLYAQLHRGSDEYHLSRCAASFHRRRAAADDKGQRVWPKAGDAAEFVLVNASCSAEAAALSAGAQRHLPSGRLVAGQVSKA